MTNYLPIRPVKRPSDLAGTENGRLSHAQLTRIGVISWLHPLAARAWAGLWIAAKADRIDLTFTPGGAYRNLENQEALFARRWTTTPIYGRPTTFYNGQRWYLRRGMARSARPGNSNHGWGLALDVAIGTEPATATSLTAPVLQWLVANAASCGWSWETPEEPWHIRYVDGDRLPQRVLDIENYLKAQQ